MPRNGGNPLERQPARNPRVDHAERYRFARDIIGWAGKKVGHSYLREKRVLDAACGTGYGTRILAHEFPAVGVDIEESVVAQAQKDFPECTFVHGDVRDAPWKGNFRAVVSFETLEHIPDPEIALALFRKAAPILVCSVPNEDAFPFDAKKFEGNKYPHRRHYTPEEFTRLLEAAGYSILLKNHQEGKMSVVEEGTTGRTLVWVAI